MKLKNTGFLVGLLLLLSSCSNWLDVDLINEVEEEKLFSTEQGFHEALAGIYSKMSKSELYGAEMTFGVVDVLAQTYDYSNMLADYNSLVNYNYAMEDAKGYIESLWSSGYYTIAMINNLLKYEANSGDVMTDKVRKQIKGEALALRAWMHFDLWRLFAPSYGQDAQMKKLPYNREFGVETTELSTSEQFLKACIEDCTEALKCLENDPIIKVKPYMLADKNESDQYVARINYYAVKGLLARIYITRNAPRDKELARTLAEEVINSERFALMEYRKAFGTETDTKWDILFSDEHIFSLRNKKIREYSEVHHRVDPGPGNTGNLQMSPDLKSEVYAGSANDIRLNRWVAEARVMLRKYYLSEANAEAIVPKVPMMKLSEMYLIAAEGWLDEDAEKAKSLVETMRKSRFMDVGGEYKLTSLDSEVLLSEMRREYLCEGQIFFAYKRLHHDILRQAAPGNIKASNEVFVLPIPEVEEEYGNR